MYADLVTAAGFKPVVAAEKPPGGFDSHPLPLSRVAASVRYQGGRSRYGDDRGIATRSSRSRYTCKSDRPASARSRCPRQDSWFSRSITQRGAGDAQDVRRREPHEPRSEFQPRDDVVEEGRAAICVEHLDVGTMMHEPESRGVAEHQPAHGQPRAAAGEGRERQRPDPVPWVLRRPRQPEPEAGGMTDSMVALGIRC